MLYKFGDEIWVQTSYDINLRRAKVISETVNGNLIVVYSTKKVPWDSLGNWWFRFNFLEEYFDEILIDQIIGNEI